MSNTKIQKAIKKVRDLNGIPLDTLQRMAAVCHAAIKDGSGYLLAPTIYALTPEDLQHIERLAKGGE